MRRRRSALAAAAAAVSAALAVILAWPEVEAQGEDPLKPGAELKSDGTIVANLKPDDVTVTVAIAKNVTAKLDLKAKYPVRVDRSAKRGTDIRGIFSPGRPVIVLGRPSKLMQSASTPDRGIPRIAPYHALVIGDGFTPKDVLPAAKDKFGEKVRWFLTTVDRIEPPDVVWVREKEEKIVYQLVVGREDRVLTTAVYESANFKDGDLRRALLKGQPVRFRGKVEKAIYTDAKGNEVVEEADRKKAGVRAEVHVTPARLALLDPSFSYAYVETAGSD